MLSNSKLRFRRIEKEANSKERTPIFECLIRSFSALKIRFEFECVFIGENKQELYYITVD